MNVKQFPYHHETYGRMFGYLLYSGNRGILIDPNPCEEMERWCREQGIMITLISNTHLHSDHTEGNGYFADKPGISFLKPMEAVSQGKLLFGDETLKVHHVPGHSKDSVIFLTGDILVSGDTLFNGTIGNCYTGNYEQYFKSLDFIMSLPEETRIYAAHDLVEYAMGVAAKIDPENSVIQEYLAAYSPKEDVFSTIALEKMINPFVRWDDPALDEYRQKLKMPVSSPYERWRAMMSVH